MKNYDIISCNSGTKGLQVVFKVNTDLVLLTLSPSTITDWDVIQYAEDNDTVTLKKLHDFGSFNGYPCYRIYGRAGNLISHATLTERRGVIAADRLIVSASIDLYKPNLFVKRINNVSEHILTPSELCNQIREGAMMVQETFTIIE